MIRFTTSLCPENTEIQDAAGLPWGCVVTPFPSDWSSSDSDIGIEARKSEDIGRCSKCFGYINPFVVFERNIWRCSLCRFPNEIPAGSRYDLVNNKAHLPELTQPFIECESSELPPTILEHSTYTMKKRSTLGQVISHVVVVDLTGGETYIELIKEGILAALEALPTSSRFGMIVFSETIGVIDLRMSKNARPTPHIRYIPIPPDHPPTIALEDIFSLETFLVPLESHEQNIHAAVEALPSLMPHFLSVGNNNNNNHNNPGISSKRGLGATMQTLIDFIHSFQSPENSVNLRVSLFLAGSPNFGVGSIALENIEVTKSEASTTTYAIFDTPFDVPYVATHAQQIPINAQHVKKPLQLKPETDFYRSLAHKASHAGVSIDMYVLSPLFNSPSTPYIGFSSLKYLSIVTGGHVIWYKSLVNSTLPQDIYRHITQPQAFHGILRLRTSLEFKVARAYGNLTANPNYENLYHIESSGPYQAFAFDFEFSDTSRFEVQSNYKPTIQLAYAYTYIPPFGVAEDSEAHHSTQKVQRRLRIHTIQQDIASHPKDLYNTVDVDTILCMLVRKVMRVCLEEGITEGRQLLHMWATMLVARYNEQCPLPLTQHKQSPSIDITLSQFPTLRNLSRRIYALLHSPLLLPQEITPSYKDTWHFLHSVYLSLEPRLLQRAIYPVLYSYGALNNLSLSYVPLNKSSITSSGNRVFLIDAYFSIVLYYDSSASDLPLPPPKDSLVRSTISQLKMDRPFNPIVTMTRSGGIEESEFFNLLLEDPYNSSLPSYSAFMDSIGREVIQMINGDGPSTITQTTHWATQDTPV